ncbi:hypothetical protein [Nostoc sphaeroides]|uniref:ATP-dependent exoDNAse n=1 Tax=Nostoc sphaeroides CCNUC1 TaxID=2653204 RepID=A0A5P8WI52_9NOSO|nr:hypothetical protein [Nostoc sphaeroides]QFS52495.1 ATP-dependent exoDNAse [Nostoc sphaeroides CCNUC1]
MFDERHSQLISSYAKSSDYFARNIIAPLIKYVCADTVEQWNNQARFELGKDTYALKLDGDGGYSWAKVDPKTNNFVTVDPEEAKEVEKIVEQSLANTNARQHSSASTESLSTNTSITDSRTNNSLSYGDYRSEIEF